LKARSSLGNASQILYNIKTKYGINDVDLDTFNLANPKNVPANKKLAYLFSLIL